MESEGGARAGANHITAHINTATDVVRDAYQGKATDHSLDSSSSLSAPPSSIGSPNVAEANGPLGLEFVSDAWQVLIGTDRALAEAGVEYDTEAQIDDPLATNRLLELMSTSRSEVLDALDEPEYQTFYTITRPGTLLPPPLAMPERPSTISRIKDDLTLDVSEFFDIDAAVEPLSSVSLSDGKLIQEGDSSLNDVLPSNSIEDIFDPEVSFEEYSKLSRFQEGARTLKSNSLIERHGHLTSAAERHHIIVAPRMDDEPKYRADPDIDVLKEIFESGGGNGFLPAFSDPIHDAELSAFAAAGRSVNRQFRGVRQELESRKQAAKAIPSPSRLPGPQTSEVSTDIEEDDDFTRAGLIYVAHTLQQKSELSTTPEGTGHPYTEEETHWARSYLSDEVKVWMKRSCGVFGTKKPTWTGLDKVLDKTSHEPELLFNHTAGSSSPIPQEQLPKTRADNLNYWAGHDQVMALSELGAKWDAFERANSPTQITANELQISTTPPDALSMLTMFSPASAASCVTPDDNNMLMISTFSTPKPVIGLDDAITPRAIATASSDLSIAPIAVKLSKVILDSSEEPGAGSRPQVVETNTPLLTCTTCSKVYKKNAYLLKHEAEGSCKPKTPNTDRLATVTKLSMTDQELIDNGLPGLEARNHKNMPYCTACKKEFSTTGRLRSHVLQFCPILRGRGLYDKPQDQQLQQLRASLPSETYVSVMKETNIGAETPEIRQSHPSSPLQRATPALIQPMARCETIHRSQHGHSPTRKIGLSTTALKDATNSLQIYVEQSNMSADQLLPEICGDNDDVEERSGLKYPERMRLFSEELRLSSPHKSVPLEPFEDLPQTTKRVRTINPGLVSPEVARSTLQRDASAQSLLSNHSSVILSFSNESEFDMATQTLEELILGSMDPTLQSLRVWPSFFTGSFASKSTFEFKVTAPQSVDLVSILRELFPMMAIKIHGDRMLFVPGDMTAPDSRSLASLTPGTIETPAAVVVKSMKSKKMGKQGVEQPRQGSRVSSGVLESTPQTTVKTNMEDGSRDTKEVKRRHSSSNLAELHVEQENSVLVEKKRQKTSN